MPAWVRERWSCLHSTPTVISCKDASDIPSLGESVLCKPDPSMRSARPASAVPPDHAAWREANRPAVQDDPSLRKIQIHE